MQEALSCDFAELSTSCPKALRLNGNVTTCSIAAAFYQGLIDCDAPSRTAPLSAFLQAEGPKRIPAFVFERIFIRRMKLNHEVAGNWYVCNARDARAPSIWFKLASSVRDWSALDDDFSRLLMSHNIPAWKAWFEGTQLRLSEVGSQATILSADQFLDRNPCQMNIERGRVRSMLTTGEIPENALRLLVEAGDTAIDELIRSRIFINCFLELTGGRPFDVDAICRRKDQIFAAEFKRKYPSREGFFGVDQHLIKLPQLLDGICPLYHFVLEDLRGKRAKDGDPTTALTDAHIGESTFRWHVLRLKPNFELAYTAHLETRGSDSGQRGGVREQAGIPASEFIHLPPTGAIDVFGL
ncbi:hypothetical protein [Rhodanobacter sp. UC4436_H3]